MNKAAEMPELAKKHGIEFLAGPTVSNEHKGVAIIKTENVDGINDFLQESGLIQWNSVEVILSQMIDEGTSCGSVPFAPNALEFQGEGTYNSMSGSRFRVCVQDNGEGSSGEPDRFYLECLSGCSYKTGSSALNDAIDGGNIQVHKPTGQAPAGTQASGASDPRPATMILNPLLLTDGIVGALQLFTVTVYDQNQDLLANAGVTLKRVTPGGLVETLTGVTGVSGTAVFTVVNLADVTEYIARAGTAMSNAIEVTPLLQGLGASVSLGTYDRQAPAGLEQAVASPVGECGLCAQSAGFSYFDLGRDGSKLLGL